MSRDATPADVLDGRAPWCVVHGESADVLPTLPAACFDALVTDPPAGIAFMGLEFDRNRGGRAQWVAWLAGILGAARTCVKPGGRAVVWSLPRTSHWTGCAVEDAGWSIETTAQHIFSTGWPKGKSQLKPASETWWLARTGPSTPLEIDACRVGTSKDVPASPPTAENRIYGKRSVERGNTTGYDASIGRWPPNVVFSHSHGCVCEGVRRVRGDARTGGGSRPGHFFDVGSSNGDGKPCAPGHADPDGLETVDAWVCVDGCPVRELDEATGELGRAGNLGGTPRGSMGYHGGASGDLMPRAYNDVSATPSRFFPQFPADDPADPWNEALFTYQAKPSRAEKSAGCEELEPSDARRFAFKRCALCGKQPVNVPGSACVCAEPRWERAEVVDPASNDHPTVKSVALMRWLIRLVTKPGDVVCDPFGGSGTTGVAALLEGRRVVLIERGARYVEIARARCEHARPSRERLRTMATEPLRAAPAGDHGPLFAGRVA